jgi:hypothetical protein
MMAPQFSIAEKNALPSGDHVDLGSGYGVPSIVEPGVGARIGA